MIKTKFCGMMRDADIDIANRLKPEFVGFVFAKKSKRLISFDKAKAFRHKLDPTIRSVGVFVNEEIESIIKNKESFDIIQLHGQESEEYIRELRSLTDKKIIKAFNISCKNDIENAKKTVADFALLDGRVAGSGESFEWNMLTGFDREYFLAGGLNVENIAEAKNLEPFAVDVSSGIEMNGIKNEYLMSKFIEIVRKGNG